MPPAWPRDTAQNDDAHPSAAQERLNGGGAPSQFIVVSSGPARWPAAPSARTCPALPAGSTRRAGPSPPPRCGCDVSTGSFPLPPPGPGWEPFPPLHSPLFPPFARRTPAACDPLSPGPHTQTPFTPSSHISLHTGTGPFPVPPQPSPDAPLLQGPHQLVAPPSRIPFLLTWTASNPCLPLSLPAKPLSSYHSSPIPGLHNPTTRLPPSIPPDLVDTGHGVHHHHLLLGPRHDVWREDELPKALRGHSPEQGGGG